MLPVILDMDPGVDDAMALLLALGLAELDVRAVTTVSGNVPVEIGTDNALRVLDLAGAEGVQPDLLRRARRVVAMDGAVHAPGNVTPTAEHNSWADPVAADIVLLGGFLREAAGTPIATGQREYGTDGIVLHDPLAVTLAARPGLGEESCTAMQVEIRGRVTAGQVVPDERTFADPARQEGVRVDWVHGVDRTTFLVVIAAGLRDVAARRPEGAAPHAASDPGLASAPGEPT